MSIEDMIAELEEYFETAGFKDIYERDLSHRSEDEIRYLYKCTFVDNDD